MKRRDTKFLQVRQNVVNIGACQTFMKLKEKFYHYLRMIVQINYDLQARDKLKKGTLQEYIKVLLLQTLITTEEASKV